MTALSQIAIVLGTWDCVTCCEQYGITIKPWVTEDGEALVCQHCIATRFEHALENDYSWPARFGAKELNVRDYAAVLDDRLVNAILTKESEYAARANSGVVPEAVEGQVRGLDYQLCPKCCMLVALRDGCNHCVCLCMQSFCFVCGKEAVDGSDHWVAGGCPRYGQIGSDRAVYDSAPEEEVADRTRWLENGLVGEDLNTVNALMDTAEEFNIGPWAWTVAMQASRRDPLLQTAMQQLLQADEWDLSFEDRDRIGRALRAYHGMHRVSEQQWSALIGIYFNQLHTFLTDGPTRADGTSHPMVRQGLLSQPVGAIYNMVTLGGRVSAFMWMYEVVRRRSAVSIDPEHDRLDDEQRSVVFDTGPGGDHWTRFNARWLLIVLICHGDELSKGMFTFTHIRDASVLVTVNAPQPNGDNRWRHEAYWRLGLLYNWWSQIVYMDDDMPNENNDLHWHWLQMLEDTRLAWEQQTGTPAPRLDQ